MIGFLDNPTQPVDHTCAAKTTLTPIFAQRFSPKSPFASDASGVLVAQGAAVEPGDGEGLGQVGLAQDG